MSFPSKWQRKADQEQEMASLAAKDKDFEAYNRHMANARKYQELANIENTD